MGSGTWTLWNKPCSCFLDMCLIQTAVNHTHTPESYERKREASRTKKVCLWCVFVCVIRMHEEDLERFGLQGTERQNQPVEQEMQSDRTRNLGVAMTHDGHWAAMRGCFLLLLNMLSILIKQCCSIETVGLQVYLSKALVFPVIQIRYVKDLRK